MIFLKSVCLLNMSVYLSTFSPSVHSETPQNTPLAIPLIRIKQASMLELEPGGKSKANKDSQSFLTSTGLSQRSLLG
jgi:hypothetical protein